MPITELTIAKLGDQRLNTPFTVHGTFMFTGSGLVNLEYADNGANTYNRANPAVTYNATQYAFQHPGFKTAGPHFVTMAAVGLVGMVKSNTFNVA